MSAKAVCAGLVHLFTALGIIPAFFALIATMEHRYEAAFIWLGVAFIIDGLDGPLARHFDTKTNLPQFCGERLDLIIDYVTYVLIPAFMIYQAGLLPGGCNAVAAIVILLSSLYHFSDTESKTDDGYFVGFPAIWNLVVFYLFAVPIPPFASFVLIASLAALTFVPFKWVHPVRVRAMRGVTFAAMAAWGVAAIAIVATGFPGPALAQMVLVATGAYAVVIGVVRSAGYGAKPHHS